MRAVDDCMKMTRGDADDGNSFEVRDHASCEAEDSDFEFKVTIANPLIEFPSCAGTKLVLDLGVVVLSSKMRGVFRSTNATVSAMNAYWIRDQGPRIKCIDEFDARLCGTSKW